MMFPILFFALRRRFFGFFRSAESILGLILRFVFMAALALSAGTTGWLIDLAATSDKMGANPNNLILISNGVVCGQWVWMEFFPTYTPRSTLFSKTFPIPYRSQWIGTLLYDAFTVSVVGSGLLFVILNAFSKTYTNTHLMSSLLLLGNAVVFVQLLKAFLESTHRRQAVFLLSWGMLSVLIGFSAWHWRFDPTGLLLVVSVAFASQTILLFLVDRAAVARTESTVLLVKTNYLSPVYTAFINNAQTRKAFAFGILMKALLLLFSSKMSASDFSMADFLLLLYVSPMILFNYVANNSWGFFPALWINGALGKRSEVYLIYFQLLIIPVLIDLIATVSVLAFLNLLSGHLLSFYLISTVCFSLNGLLFSQYKAFRVHNSLSFGQAKSNVSGWSIFINFLLLIGIGLALKTAVTTFALCLGLVVAVVYVFRSVLPRDRNAIHRIYKSVFVDRE
ncbi:hypothetical protein ACS5NO_09515 [Larkinella sp. GY13]|uniref:hypothetical protein n=1 Tax=Larkinella sp. GY13 TaxID=3453720 RepID=UPI003EECCD9F